MWTETSAYLSVLISLISAWLPKKISKFFNIYFSDISSYSVTSNETDKTVQMVCQVNSILDEMMGLQALQCPIQVTGWDMLRWSLRYITLLKLPPQSQIMSSWQRNKRVLYLGYKETLSLVIFGKFGGPHWNLRVPLSIRDIWFLW